MYIAISLHPIDNFLIEANKYIGVQESPKLSNRGVEIDYWLKETDVNFGSPWCAAFVTAIGRQSLGNNWPVIMSASVQKIVDWANILKSLGVVDSQPQKGDLFAIYFNSLKRYGHIGIVESVDADGFGTIEGNTNTEGSRDGYGVFKRVRKFSSSYLFIRWIKTLPTSEGMIPILVKGN